MERRAEARGLPSTVIWTLPRTHPRPFCSADKPQALNTGGEAACSLFPWLPASRAERSQRGISLAPPLLPCWIPGPVPIVGRAPPPRPQAASLVCSLPVQPPPYASQQPLPALACASPAADDVKGSGLLALSPGLHGSHAFADSATSCPFRGSWWCPVSPVPRNLSNSPCQKEDSAGVLPQGA